MFLWFSSTMALLGFFLNNQTKQLINENNFEFHLIVFD